MTLKSGFPAAFLLFLQKFTVTLNSAEHFIHNKLEARKTTGNYRQLKPENSLIDFCSNDYLGFSRSAELKEMIGAELENHPDFLIGSTGSRLLTGNLIYTERLEAQIAAWHRAEAGLLFNSGYDANIGLLSSLPQRNDTIICDELIHASLIDGIRLSNANRYSFRHNDVQSLEQKLKHAKGICYIVVESVYSMDGDIAPLSDIAKLAEQHGAHLVVDEAHAVGVFGRGLVPDMNLEQKVFARIVTFGKALGCHGAIILGKGILRNYLLNFARSFIYSTASSFHQQASIKMAYELLVKSDDLITQLHQNIGLFKQDIRSSELIESPSAIQCIVAGSNERAVLIAEKLNEAGIDVRPILSPTVAAGAERVRICIHSFNTPAQINLLTRTINQLA